MTLIYCQYLGSFRTSLQTEEGNIKTRIMILPSRVLAAQWSLCQVQAVSVLCWGHGPCWRIVGRDLWCHEVSWTVTQFYARVVSVHLMTLQTYPAECWERQPLYIHTRDNITTITAIFITTTTAMTTAIYGVVLRSNYVDKGLAKKKKFTLQHDSGYCLWFNFVVLWPHNH